MTARVRSLAATALMTAMLIASASRSPLQAIERKALPDFPIAALDGAAAKSGAMVAAGPWLLVYVQQGCAACDTLVQLLADEHAKLEGRVAIVIGGVTATDAAKLAANFPALAAARWYADQSNALLRALPAAGAPVVYGLRENMVEWSLNGVVPDAASYRTTLLSWVGAQSTK
jgi:hypothetical protein